MANPSLPSFVEPLDGGLFVVDTGFHREGFDAAYLLVEGGRAAFVETGPNSGVPRLLAALDALGVARDAVDYVIPTHVHLDHAGGIGRLMAALPAARAVVHPRGFRHLVDPGALWAGATEVYGAAEVARSYGEPVAVPAERVLASDDGMRLAVGGRELRLVHTPGHAKHHHCIWDERTRGWFTGDTFGVSLRAFDGPGGAWIVPATPPVQFEPEALEASLQHLLSFDPQWVYLTHYGRVGDVARLGALAQELLRRMVELGTAECGAPQRHRRLVDGLRAIYRESLAAHGCALDAATIDALLALDVELNARGMACWLDRR